MQGLQKTQYETDFGLRISDCGLRDQRFGPARRTQPAIRNPQSAIRLRRGFTLTELLIVIAIIGVLASLIAVAAKAALDNMHRNRTLLAIKNISGSLENFKNDYGSYPPNGMHDNSTVLINQISSDFTRTMKKAFPRMHRDEEALLRAIAGANPGAAPSFVLTGNVLSNGPSAAEALVLWLGGFSSDSQYPLSGPGGPSFVVGGAAGGEILEDRKWRYTFELSQLVPRDAAGGFNEEDSRFIEYRIDLNGDGDNNDANETRRINFWQFAPAGSEQPLLYFDVSRRKPADFDPPAAPGSVDTIFALKKYREGRSSAATKNDFAFVNQGKYQIMHCGLDDDWGDFGVSASNNATTIDDLEGFLFPTGPFIGAVADTLTNVVDGKLEDAQDE